MLLTRDLLCVLRHRKYDSKRNEKYLTCNINQRKINKTLLITKWPFHTRRISTDKDGHSIMIKKSIQWEDTTMLIFM